jgi:catechol 2,3-dioxygenase-like lactoylglutathione lyase family enzyme
MSNWITSTLVFVRDVDASTAFYVDKLGFTLNMRHVEEGRALVAGVNHGDGCSFLLTSQWPDRTGSAVIYNALDQNEFTALRRSLAGNGVRTSDGFWGKPLLIVADPDGNEIWLPVPDKIAHEEAVE